MGLHQQKNSEKMVFVTSKNTSETPDPVQGVDDRLARHGGFTYLEIPASDVRISSMFYAKILGWKLLGDDAHPKFSDLTGQLIGG
jgi:hypothetical protein